MKRHHDRNCRLALETLESRHLLAGDVGVDFTGGQLTLDGDGAANAVSISQDAAGDLIVRGLDDNDGVPTLVNGFSSLRLENATILRVEARMHSGADRLEISDLSVGDDVLVEMADGPDTVLVQGSSISTDLNLDTGEENDEIELRDSTIGNDLSVESLGGSDDIHVLRLGVGRDLRLHSGTAPDDVILGILSVGGDVVIETAGGADVVDLREVEIGTALADNLSVLTGDGSDRVYLASVDIVFGNIAIETGAGADSVVVRQSAAGNHVDIATDGEDDIVAIFDVNAGVNVATTTGLGEDRVTAERITAGNNLTIETNDGDDEVIIEDLVAGENGKLDGGDEFDRLFGVPAAEFTVGSDRDVINFESSAERSGDDDPVAVAQELVLNPAGPRYKDWGGWNEKWIQGDDGQWHFITPDGVFRKWHGGPLANSTLLNVFHVVYHDDPELFAKGDVDTDNPILLAKALGLEANGNLFEDWGGWNEKWIQGEDGRWYFIRPKGDVYRWHGGNITNSTQLFRLPVTYYDDPTLLNAEIGIDELATDLSKADFLVPVVYRGATISLVRQL